MFMELYIKIRLKTGNLARSLSELSEHISLRLGKLLRK